MAKIDWAKVRADLQEQVMTIGNSSRQMRNLQKFLREQESLFSGEDGKACIAAAYGAGCGKLVADAVAACTE